MMRRIGWPLTVAMLAFVVGPAGASEKEARDIVERAIKAHGGEAGLEKARFCVRSESGVRSQPGGKDIAFASESIRLLPDRVRLQIDVADKKLQTIVVLNGDKGWIRSGGMATEMARPLVQEMREEAIVWWQSTLLPLTKGPFTLSTIPGMTIDGEEAVGIKVTGAGYVETRMYFFKRSGLLARIERRASDGGAAGEKVFLFSNYKSFDGVRLPGKEVQLFNARKIVELTINKYRFLDKLEPGTFDRP
jgi:hypothetical protein